MPLTLTSPAFAQGDRLPEKYARDDRNLSPPLHWSGVPDGTKSLVLVLEDPDAPNGTWRHWAVFNIPPDRTDLPESVETGPDATGLHVGMNDFGTSRYEGPQPPVGDRAHTYHFRLAAVDIPRLHVRGGEADARTIWEDASRHVIEQTELVATYQR